MKKRRETLAKDGPVDWAFAEAVAFGSLVLEGVPVRLSGQDPSAAPSASVISPFTISKTAGVTFRCSTWGRIKGGQSSVLVYDSSLSEFGVLGFDYGYSVSDPQTLTLWEAQFGDFSNGAQVIVDQFITTAEQKWSQTSGLVMLLPHGYEGQGPEHSSGRMERFLLLCAEENMRIANCSTPAQYFHILRRQMATAPKPLVVFTPKSLLLRSAAAVSELRRIDRRLFPRSHRRFARPLTRAQGSSFVPARSTTIFVVARACEKSEDIAIVRIEVNLYPFPGTECHQRSWLAAVPAADPIWCQEEPRNMGAWKFMAGYFKGLDRVIHYAGRVKNASPAAGSHKRHAEEQKRLIEDALK